MKQLLLLLLIYLGAFVVPLKAQNIFDQYYIEDRFKEYQTAILGNYIINDRLFTTVRYFDSSKFYGMTSVFVSNMDGEIIDEIAEDFSNFPDRGYGILISRVFSFKDTIYFCYQIGSLDFTRPNDPEYRTLVRFYKYDFDLNFIESIDFQLEHIAEFMFSSQDSDKVTMLFHHMTPGGFPDGRRYTELVFDNGEFSTLVPREAPMYQPFEHVPEVRDQTQVIQVVNYKGRKFLSGWNDHIFEVDEDDRVINYQSGSYLANRGELPWEYFFGRISIINDTILMIGEYRGVWSDPPSDSLYRCYIRLDLDFNLIDYGKLTSGVDILEFENWLHRGSVPLIGDKFAVMVQTQARVFFESFPFNNQLVFYIVDNNTMQIEHTITYSNEQSVFYYSYIDGIANEHDSFFIFPTTYTFEFDQRAGHSRLLRVDTNGKLISSGSNSIHFPNIGGVAISVDVRGNPSDGWFQVHSLGIQGASDLTMFDLQGKVVYRGIISDDQTIQTDLSHLASGVYPFQITQNGKPLIHSKWVRK